MADVHQPVLQVAEARREVARLRGRTRGDDSSDGFGDVAEEARFVRVVLLPAFLHFCPTHGSPTRELNCPVSA